MSSNLNSLGNWIKKCLMATVSRSWIFPINVHQLDFIKRLDDGRGRTMKTCVAWVYAKKWVAASVFFFVGWLILSDTVFCCWMQSGRTHRVIQPHPPKSLYTEEKLSFVRMFKFSHDDPNVLWWKQWWPLFLFCLHFNFQRAANSASMLM